MTAHAWPPGDMSEAEDRLWRGAVNVRTTLVSGRLSTERLLLMAMSLALALAPAGSRAEERGTIAGTVTDASGAVLPGVTVDLLGAAQRSTATTAASGRYALDVPPGLYDVSFRLPNFAIALKKGVQVAAGGTAEADAIMYLAAHAEVLVTGKKPFRDITALNEPVKGLLGIADAASEGVVRADELSDRPTLRAGDVLESVPGVLISQHSGEGKANQYYLRGFNLDHGTDLATTVAGVPVNMPTHAHGQGYSDLNFLIPELVSGIQYKKGPYYADEGDFATAGAINVNYSDSLEKPLVKLERGGEGYGRALLAGSTRLGQGQLLGALEFFHNNGPWVRGDDYRKINGIVRYSQGDRDQGFELTGMGYDGRWNSTDQVAERAVDSGLISRFGTLDPTDGGRSHRYVATADFHRRGAESLTRAQAYVVGYSLDLFSNFTYFLDDPVRGDQFHQEDRRTVTGAKVSHEWFSTLGGRESETTVGVQFRRDEIGTVGLFHTQARRQLETTRLDSVLQTSGALYAQNSLQVAPKVRMIVGLRGDFYHFRVSSDDPANSGTDTAAIASPKLAVVLGPWKDTEVYLNVGFGFHSNDGRGSTISRDSATHEPVSKVDPLVRAKGAEIGVRTSPFKGYQTTLTLWGLDIASELVFSGDAGTTEPNRPSRRLGFEWANEYRPLRWLAFDAGFAYSRARFTDFAPSGDHVPGAIEDVGSADVLVDGVRGLFGSLQLRYFGPRSLIEDDSVRSRSAATLNGRLGYDLSKNVRLSIDVLNLFNAKVSDIDYYYASRLPGEPPDGVNDVHTHPIEPRMVHGLVSVRF